MTRIRIAGSFVLGIVMVIGLMAAWAPGARADDAVTWQLAFAGQCTSAAPCLGYTNGQGACAFTGTTTSGHQATCQGSFRGPAGLLLESIQGTAWDVELSPATGTQDFFITDGTIVFAGSEVVLILMAGLPVPPGCTVSGATITCSLAAVIAAGLVSADTLNPVIPGHYAADFCFASGAIDPGCSYNQQLTLVT